MRRILVYYTDNKIVVAMEHTKVFADPLKTMLYQLGPIGVKTIEPLYTLPYGYMGTATLMADITAQANNCPICFGGN